MISGDVFYFFSISSWRLQSQTNADVCNKNRALFMLAPPRTRLISRAIYSIITVIGQAPEPEGRWTNESGNSKHMQTGRTDGQPGRGVRGDLRRQAVPGRVRRLGAYEGSELVSRLCADTLAELFRDAGEITEEDVRAFFREAHDRIVMFKSGRSAPGKLLHDGGVRVLRRPPHLHRAHGRHPCLLFPGGTRGIPHHRPLGGAARPWTTAR